jgi:hypothetical protein
MGTLLIRPGRLINVNFLLLLALPCAWCFQGVDAGPSATLYALSSPEVLRSPNILPNSELLFIDPVTGTTRRTVRIGFSADAQLSPDGKRIYVSSSYVSAPNVPDRKCFIETFDTATGALVAKVLNPDGQQYTSDIHDVTAMAISPTGNWLYITKLQFKEKSKSYSFYIAAFNTSSRRFLPARFFLSGCQAPTLLPSKKDLELSAVCADGTYIRKITFHQSDVLDIPISLPNAFVKSGLAVVVDQSQIGTLTFISGTGGVISVDKSSGQITERNANLHFQRDLGLVRGLVSGTRHEAYFGSAVEDHEGPERFDEIVGIDVNSGSVIHAVRVQPFFNLTLSQDEKTVYLTHPSKSTITVLDAATMKEINSIPLIAKTPYFAAAR